MGLILDTDYCVAILRDAANLGESIPATPPFYVAVTTVVELAYGAIRSHKSAVNLARLDEFLAVVSVLPFETGAARRMAALKVELERKGAFIGDPDLEIASIALEQNLPLVTHNRRHFERISGLMLIDWLS